MYKMTYCSIESLTFLPNSTRNECTREEAAQRNDKIAPLLSKRPMSRLNHYCTVRNSMVWQLRAGSETEETKPRVNKTKQKNDVSPFL